MLEAAVKDSTSFTGVIEKLGKKMSGGLHGHLKLKIKSFGINTDHFTGRASRMGISPTNKRHWAMVLVRREKRFREKAKSLRAALIEYGRAYECEECGNGSMWNGKPLCLIVDHKDGNWLNNVPDNLRFLCSNCHSQTETFGTKNIRNAIVA